MSYFFKDFVICIVLLLPLYFNLHDAKPEDDKYEDEFSSRMSNWTLIRDDPEIYYLASMSLMNYTKYDMTASDKTRIFVLLHAKRHNKRPAYHITYNGHKKVVCELYECRFKYNLVCDTYVEHVRDLYNPLNISETVCEIINPANGSYVWNITIDDNDLIVKEDEVELTNIYDDQRQKRDIEELTSISNQHGHRQKRNIEELINIPYQLDHHKQFLASFAILKYAAMVNEDPNIFQEITITSSRTNKKFPLRQYLTVAADICSSPTTDQCVQVGHVICETIVDQKLDIFRPIRILKLNCSETHGRNWMKLKSMVNASELRKAFQRFLRKYNKTYFYGLEYEYRFQVFIENVEAANELNDRDKGNADYGVTQFSDIPPHVFQRKYLGGLFPLGGIMTVPNAVIPDINVVPEQFDWTGEGVVTPVKNQGDCGSCWAFSTIANIESLWAIKSGMVDLFSEQQLMDCGTLNQGCLGGLMDLAYKEIAAYGGVVYEKEYEYTGIKSECQRAVQPRLNITGGVLLPQDEDEILKYLYVHGPLSASINSNAAQFYRGGVSFPSSTDCSPLALNHAMLLVGYGVEKSGINEEIPYWILKNSWGPSYGENGFYRIYRGAGACGVNVHVTSALL